MSLDNVKRSLAGFIRGVMHPVDYFALYAARVVQQNAATLELELQPDDPRLPGMQRVPIRTGLPGCKVKVGNGSRVLLSFENGSPSAPVALLWGESTITELAIGANPTKHIALAEDVKAALDAIVAWTGTHVHPSGALIAPPGGGAVTGATAVASGVSTNTNVASATVKST